MNCEAWQVSSKECGCNSSVKDCEIRMTCCRPADSPEVSADKKQRAEETGDNKPREEP